jgi:iron complex outermembrane receptor protein
LKSNAKPKLLKMKKIVLTIISAMSCVLMFAQQGTVSGTVVDGSESLIGVSISVGDSGIGTITDLDGSYKLSLDPGTYEITASYVGYNVSVQTVTVVAGENSTVNFQLSSGVLVDEIVVTGTRAFGRTNTDSPVPIDVIDVSKLASRSGQVSVNEILNVAAPSFTSQSQTVSDGTDHIDPASLRGLGPDQVLVLINGKRRHNTSLLNINGTVGAGAVGTDMNAIPAASIKRIEVLRDGAAAQYGSDAIAGVINIVLKEETDGLELGITAGANASSLGNHQEGGIDGEKVQIDASYGLPVGDKGGFINLTGSIGTRNPALRNATNLEKLFDIDNTAERIYLEGNPTGTIADMTSDDYATILDGLPQNFKDAAADEDYNVLDDLELAARGQTRSDYRFKVGTAKLREGKAFLNMAIPLSETSEVYAFGGVGSREGLAFGFLREPWRPKSNTAANYNGFLPGIQSNIIDKSLAFGIRGSYNGWDVDFSNTFGANDMKMTVVNSTNASLGAASPSTFEAGAFGFSQNTTNLDFTRKHDNILSGLRTSFGTEYRVEEFSITAGAENSYATYDDNGIATVGGAPGATNAQGESLDGTAQVFGGFTPVNALTKSRNSLAGYADFELEATDRVLVALAARYEDFSDFGNTFNYKLATRIKATDNVSVRAAFSTGFRAPSLHQQFFSRSSTIFDANGVAQEEGLFTNASRAAQLIGIDKLKEETSQSISAGATAKAGAFSLTIDAYQIDIDDRIILSGAFDDGGDPELASLFKAAGAGKARFLANAIDTKTQGIDIVIGYRLSMDSGLSLNNNLAATFSKNEVVNIMVPEKIANAGLSGDFFDGQEEAFLTLAQPRSKLSLSNTLSLTNGLEVSLRNVWYGSVTDPDDFSGDARVEGTVVSEDALYDAKLITDLSLSYPINDKFRVSLGANNLLDVYPTENRAGGQSNASFPYSRRTSQFGFAGRYMFVRANFTL